MDMGYTTSPYNRAAASTTHYNQAAASTRTHALKWHAQWVVLHPLVEGSIAAPLRRTIALQVMQHC
jgi:hypothetical protein